MKIVRTTQWKTCRPSSNYFKILYSESKGNRLCTRFNINEVFTWKLEKITLKARTWNHIFIKNWGNQLHSSYFLLLFSMKGVRSETSIRGLTSWRVPWKMCFWTKSRTVKATHFFNQKNKRNTYVFSYVLCIAQTL